MICRARTNHFMPRGSALLAGLNRLWVKLGVLLGKLISPIVLGWPVLRHPYPVGAVMRLTGKDPLRLKLDPDADSYWIRRERRSSAYSMINQF